MPERAELQQDWDDLGALYLQAVDLLDGLDRLELHQAAAHLSMTIALMRQRHPYLLGLD
jgi:hypothetical protein